MAINLIAHEHDPQEKQPNNSSKLGPHPNAWLNVDHTYFNSIHEDMEAVFIGSISSYPHILLLGLAP
jgi:hypothetical protein